MSILNPVQTSYGFQDRSFLPTPASLLLPLTSPITLAKSHRLPSLLHSLHLSSPTDVDTLRLSSIMKLYGRPCYPGGLGH